jgi:pyruvate dehydrogenase E2 component (dihydrolipoamide acetyltransferase)
MSELVDIVLPDIGDYTDVPVVEINVAVGDVVAVDAPLLSIESDKATMEVPSPSAGVIKELKVAVGSRVSQGALLMIIAEQKTTDNRPAESSMPAPPQIATATPERQTSEKNPLPTLSLSENVSRENTHATPSVRALARELGVGLENVKPTGPKGRLLRADVAAYVKHGIRSGAAPATATGVSTLEWPKVDFEKFGAIERAALSRIQKIAGANLSRNWNMIPHVTNFDKADVTDAEEFRRKVNSGADRSAVKLTMVSILIKASALALKAFPPFNSSLDGDELVLKKYVHIGFAVDTPKGLMVPVIRDCDKKGLLDIASEMRILADRATAGGLSASDMQGGCFSVSSIGGIGGSGFTPIINAPEVAILGAGRSATEAVWDGSAFKPRLMLPLSLSWDHRVVDGVAAARFLGFVAASLSDLRRAAL